MAASMLYALAAMATAALSDLFYKAAAREGLRTAGFLQLQSVFFLGTLLAAAALWFDFRFTAFAAGLGSLCGVIAFGGFYIFLESFKRADASVATATFRLSFVVTSLLAVLLLGERMTWGKAGGTALAALALLSFMGARSRGAERGGLALAALAMTLSGAMRFLHKIAAATGQAPTSFLIFQSLSFLLLTGLANREGRGEGYGRAAWRYAPISGVLLSSSTVLTLLALREGEATVVVPVVQLSFAATAAMSFLWLREPLTARKAAGLGLAAGAVWMFARAG